MPQFAIYAILLIALSILAAIIIRIRSSTYVGFSSSVQQNLPVQIRRPIGYPIHGHTVHYFRLELDLELNDPEEVIDHYKVDFKNYNGRQPHVRGVIELTKSDEKNEWPMILDIPFEQNSDIDTYYFEILHNYNKVRIPDSSFAEVKDPR